MTTKEQAIYLGTAVWNAELKDYGTAGPKGYGTAGRQIRFALEDWGCDCDEEGIKEVIGNAILRALNLL